jgi:hypothetical protein
MFIKVNQRSSKTIIFILPLPKLGWYAHFISIAHCKDRAQNTTQYKYQYWSKPVLGGYCIFNKNNWQVGFLKNIVAPQAININMKNWLLGMLLKGY